MKKVLGIIMLTMTGLLSMTLLSSCGDVESEFSTAPCSLYFDNQTHNDATLAQAMNELAPGVFVTITTTTQNGAQYFVFTNNQGGSSRVAFDAKDKLRQQNGQLILGMNGGLIVGYGNLSGEFYAYDRECPNCFDSNALPLRSYPLKVNNAGIASCSNCHRTYDLNNGGIITSGNGGKKMTRYHATGAYGLLSVW